MVHQTVGPASYRDKVPYYPQVKTSRADPLRRVPTAGKSPTGQNTTVSQSMQYELDPNNSRPSTPPEITKYRRSFKEQPGKRFINTGVFDQKFPAPSTRYGCRTIKGDRVGDAFDQVPHSELSDFLNEQKESIYRSQGVFVTRFVARGLTSACVFLLSSWCPSSSHCYLPHSARTLGRLLQPGPRFTGQDERREVPLWDGDLNEREQQRFGVFQRCHPGQEGPQL